MAKDKTIEHKGTIISIKNNIINVEIINKSMCAGCHAKSVCALGDSKEKIISVPYNNDMDYKVGDEVMVIMEKSIGFKAVWISYVIPVLILLVFLLTLQGFGLSELLAGLLSIGAVALYYILIYLFRNKMTRGFEFKIAKY